jgi:NADPH-dependent 2,4-dienoyl-CoA reductase/sulfur reductase-like enzyme
MDLLIIGGSDAGISAALRARELDHTATVRVLLADSFPNYSICGLPFYISGETPNWHQLAHRTEFEGIEVLREHGATQIDVENNSVLVNNDGESKVFRFDRVVIATGAVPVQPSITGLDLPCVFPLHTMEDSFRVHKYLNEQAPKSAAIVGAGYIGMEMADALSHLGLNITVVSRSDAVLPNVDTELGQVIQQELARRGVAVHTRLEIVSIEPFDRKLRLRSNAESEFVADLVLVATGVRPSSELAFTSGINTGIAGAIRVNRRMETNIPFVYAAGDCVETWDRVLNDYTYLPLGTTSHKQGRIAGENAIGGDRQFAGSVGTQVVKVFELAIARTGLLESEARRAGFDPFTFETVSLDHKAYYPDAHELRIRITGDRSSQRLLGAQIIGHWKAEIAKRIDIFATALFHEMTVDTISDLDLSYTPPLGSPWDAVQMSAQAWSRALKFKNGRRELADA